MANEEVLMKEKPAVALTVEEFSRQWMDFQEFVKSQLQEGVDYGRVPGIRKPFLMLPGAEKICSRYIVRPEFSFLEKLEDWDKDLFNFEVKCVLKQISTDRIVGEGIGSCNSYEEKYRYVWVTKSNLGNKEILETRERKGKYGKYTEYKIKRDDLATLHNTILKMAKKRAIVDASLTLGNASGMFTQDIEDLPKKVIQAEVMKENTIEKIEIAPDNGGNKEENESKRNWRDEPATEKQIARIERDAKKLGWSESEIEELTEELTKGKAGGIIGKFEEELKRPKNEVEEAPTEGKREQVKQTSPTPSVKLRQEIKETIDKEMKAGRMGDTQYEAWKEGIGIKTMEGLSKIPYLRLKKIHDNLVS